MDTGPFLTDAGTFLVDTGPFLIGTGPSLIVFLNFDRLVPYGRVICLLDSCYILLCL